MKYIVYLATLLLFSTAEAQNPTIIKGDYVSNVFGQSNFVLNPNAQTGIGNISSSSATVTRSTTTPLVATTEFNWNASAGGFSTWSTRPFDAGMKNQNCEARFTYRGFTAGTTTAQVRNSGIVIAELVLTPSATDPRTASINFPCGDLSLSTNFRLLQSGATLGGINEIGGIYVGLATNMANIAQAETVVRARQTAAQTVPDSIRTTILYQTEDLDVYGEYDPTTGIYTAKKTGEYLITASVMSGNVAWSVGEYFEIAVMKNTASNSYCRNYKEMEGNNTANEELLISCIINLQAGENTRITWTHQQGGNISTIGDGSYVFLQIARFPSSSELVVTPETQNVFAAAKWTGGSTTSVSTTTRSAITTFTGYTPYGKASSTAPVSSMEMTVANIPPGSYKLKTSLQFVSEVTSVGTIDCYLEMSDDGGSTYKILQGNTVTYQSAQAFSQVYGGSVFLNYTSLQSSKTFKIFVRKAGGAAGNCRAQVDSSNTNIILEPLDNASNSALYVQGPVKAAETGAAIPAGYVGETKTASGSNYRTSGTASAWTDITGASIQVEAGTWLVCANGQQFYYNTAGSPFLLVLGHRIQNTTDGTTLDVQSMRGLYAVTHTDNGSTFSLCKPISVTSTKTLQTQCQLSAVIGSFAFGVHNCDSSISAVRLN